ncbi:MAG: hypothetical protein KI792_13105 [Alphaproteobacteria bacterium]|nr:hypothetical protein [Alphaproteobacteria bacterium SS10]
MRSHLTTSSTAMAMAAATMLLAAPIEARADISLNIGSGDHYVDVPFDYKTVAVNYAVGELGINQQRIQSVQIVTIRQGRFHDQVTRIQAVIKLRGNLGGPEEHLVVVMRRSGSVVTHFTQG